jgi:phosphoribosylformimino-5-aminoimidazole carboxamide ribotide isomerase
MILYPAIDLKEGQCVRLRQGDMKEVTIFNSDPADQARRFQRAGAIWAHLVDLDGAFAGKPMNVSAVEAILASSRLRCQLGGGIRSMETIEAWLEKGVARVILGTIALKRPDLVRQAARAYPGRIAVGIDAKEGRVAVEGWAQSSDISALDLAMKFEDSGVAAIIFTDIARDGLMQGANWEASADLARRLSVPVVASGGVASMADIDRLIELAPATRARGAGLDGVIVGRALYDGTVDLASAQARIAAASPC